VLTDIKKILIIKLRAIGDVVLATAVIRNLRQQFPHSVIDFLVEQEAAPVVANNSDLNRVWVYPRKEIAGLPWLHATISNIRFLSNLFAQHYDLVFDLFGNPRSALMTWLTGAQYRVGYRFRGRKWAYNVQVESRSDRVHEVEFNLDALRRVGIPICSTDPVFPLAAAEKEKIWNWIESKRWQRSFRVALNPCGSWPAKRWPLVKFAELGQELIKKYDAHLILLWGPGERKIVQQLSNLINSKSVWVHPPTTLVEQAALLRYSHLFIGNDSGPMHIAAAVGTPTVGIFGPTNAKLQGPYGKGNRAVAKWEIPCLGCNRLVCPLMDCMNYLEVEDVMKVVDEVVQSLSPGIKEEGIH